MIDKAIAEEIWPKLASALRSKGCELRGDEALRAIDPDLAPASEEDFYTEYLAPILSVAHLAKSPHDFHVRGAVGLRGEARLERDANLPFDLAQRGLVLVQPELAHELEREARGGVPAEVGLEADELGLAVEEEPARDSLSGERAGECFIWERETSWSDSTALCVDAPR